MSAIRASSTDHTAADQLFDQWLEHWREEPHPVPQFARAEPAAAAAPPTQEAGSSPLPASRAAAAPLPRRHPGAADAGLAILQALTETVVEPTSRARVDTERQVGGAILRFPGRAVAAEDRLGALESPTDASALMLFSARAGLRPLLTAATVLCGAATGLWVLVAIVFPANTTLGAAAALAALTGLLWQARMRARGTAVTIENGVLKVVRGESRHQFPLTGVHPPIDVVGEPGHRGWKVLIQRRGMAPYVVDDRMVDPYEFTNAIRRFRPRA